MSLAPSATMRSWVLAFLILSLGAPGPAGAATLRGLIEGARRVLRRASTARWASAQISRETPLPATNAAGVPLHVPRPAGAAPEGAILHFSSLARDRPQAPHEMPALLDLFASAGVSAHYLVDRGGRVHELVSPDAAARHAGDGQLPWDRATSGGGNARTIGIEIMAVGSARDMRMIRRDLDDAAYEKWYAAIPERDRGYTPAQYRAVRKLVRHLQGRYPTLRHVIGHEDYAMGRKTDPGELFDWAQLGGPIARVLSALRR
jgi:N-acetyl-anhydromuramyl-L-alanine amidase AmpD